MTELYIVDTIVTKIRKIIVKMKGEEVIGAEFGSRKPDKMIENAIFCVAFFWSVFQLWVASPLQFALPANYQFLLFNNLEVRAIHLSIAIFLAFLLFPIRKDTHISKIPIYDWLLSVCSACAAFYIYLFYEEIAFRVGMPTQYDLLVAITGIILLFEASRRVLGPTIAIIASVFLLYSYFGQHLPDLIAHRGNSFNAIASHQWFSSEGVFGTALGVSADFVFLYVLFGSFLEKAGAGNFFIQLSFALLGRFTGGPAKAAVVASGLMGMMSGSSIANTITVGSFTIPLMKRMGLTAEKSAAIEVSAGINGQIMPPVMGAAAFIMSEYLSIPYPEIIKHAFLPAILIYLALLYTVHIEAKKLGIQPIKSDYSLSTVQRFARIGIISTSLIITFGAIYFLIQGLSYLFNMYPIPTNNSAYFTVPFITIVYLLVLKYQSRFPDLEEDTKQPLTKLPHVPKVLRGGIHFFIPLIILVWSLMVNRLSPSLSAFLSIVSLFVILLTQHAIKSFFRDKKDKILSDIKQGLCDSVQSMIAGARNMVPIAIATATAGIIVGTISLTGVGLRIGTIVDNLANSELFITLILTAVICIVLGVGMPTTACYIIVSTLMVPVLEYTINKNGMYVPTMALHLFVFYFGLMADVTPPIGLASYAAAAVAKANTLKTSTKAFSYNMRTMTLPFIFVFNPQILLYGITSITEFIILLVSSLIGVCMISASTQGYFLIRSKIYESIILLFVGISLLYPQGFINFFYNPFEKIHMQELEQDVEEHGDNLKIILLNNNVIERVKTKVIFFKSLPGNTINEKLVNSGISEFSFVDNKLTVNYVKEGSKADIVEIVPNDTIIEIYISNIQPNKNIILFPIGCILAMIVFIQQKRRREL